MSLTGTVPSCASFSPSSSSLLSDSSLDEDVKGADPFPPPKSLVAMATTRPPNITEANCAEMELCWPCRIVGGSGDRPTQRAPPLWTAWSAYKSTPHLDVGGQLGKAPPPLCEEAQSGWFVSPPHPHALT
ncbi:hypothetical protein JZ751_009062, partial [Albula glossodonta]